MSIEKIVSGGQSGVDRAALDAAIMLGLQYGGWCPSGGWAEDYPNSPGVLTTYPLLQETPSHKPNQRTEWNVRDSDATMILLFQHHVERSPGTELTASIAKSFSKPYIIISLQERTCADEIVTWLSAFNKSIVLNIAGPRESENPGIYDISKRLLISTLNRLLTT